MPGKIIIPVLLLTILLGVLLWERQTATEHELSRTALLMDTLVEIRASGLERAPLEAAIEAAFAEMRRLDALLSSYRPDSEIARLSASPGPLSLSSETVELLRLGQQVAQLSDGAFALDLGRAKQLWALDSEAPRIPAAAELQRALRGTGPDSLRIQGQRVSKADPGLQADLGGIAKGYAVDRALKILRAAGVSSAAVNAGGDIGLLGDHDGRPWRIGIQHPRRADDVLIRLQLSDRAVVSSGDYERYFIRDGVRYHHILDPADGRPARGCQSVTVVAASAARADALATAAFVMGPTAGLQLLESLPGVEGLLVAADGRLLKTSGLPES